MAGKKVRKPATSRGAKRARKAAATGGTKARKGGGKGKARKASGAKKPRKASGAKKPRKASGAKKARKASGAKKARKASGAKKPRKATRAKKAEKAVSGGLHLRYYLFDWDDNVVNMPTRIWMETGDGQPVGLSTAEYAKRRGEPGLRPPGGDWSAAFREFRDGTGDFAGDLRRAMAGPEGGWQGPAFGKFKEAVVGGRLFGIVTARGHAEATLRDGVAQFIRTALSPGERGEMVRSLQAFNAAAGDELDDDASVARYLKLCHFAGVSSPEYQHNSGAETPEEGKKHAIRAFVSRTLEVCGGAFAGKRRIDSIAFGMSDDDAKNVAAVEALMRGELRDKYPACKFVLYDTGGGKERKIPIN